MTGEQSSAAEFWRDDREMSMDDALSMADRWYAGKGLRLTPVRRKVLELLLRERRALGAYRILALLDEAGFGSQPPVAYRALNFLVENGFAHKVERLNAFVACSFFGKVHSPAFMICRLCDAVAETQSMPVGKALGRAASGFQIEQTLVEVEGVCPVCARNIDR